MMTLMVDWFCRWWCGVYDYDNDDWCAVDDFGDNNDDGNSHDDNVVMLLMMIITTIMIVDDDVHEYNNVNDENADCDDMFMTMISW